ncbi:hypothetical protein H6503_00455 [Candidatus Woesearchaeota archaeon]|nr:hypothetical protein [Candidatus Woesearchaeota archaeon]
MKTLKPLVLTTVIASMLATGCMTSHPSSSYGEINSGDVVTKHPGMMGRYGFRMLESGGTASCFVAPSEGLEAFLKTPNGSMLTQYSIKKDGIQIAKIAQGRSYGMHFYEIISVNSAFSVSDALKFIDGNIESNPIVEGYTIEKLKL